MRTTPAILGLMLTLAAAAQETQTAPPPPPPPAPPAPSVLENSGKPMTVPFRCSEDDMHSAGLSCSEEEPCPIFLELTAANQAGSRILVTGNIHSESVTLYGVLLSSDDSGHTWTEPHDRIRGAALDHIQFFDPAVGWIVGQELSPIPRNPFLLVTNDAGKTWQQHAIFSESSESVFGSIGQFSLSGKKDGSVVIDRGSGSTEDRYVLFESPDGGDTWAIKQESSKPLSLKNPAVPNPDWRIRADASAKAFQVEHRQGTRWSSVGAFTVKLDSCKTSQ